MLNAKQLPGWRALINLQPAIKASVSGKPLRNLTVVWPWKASFDWKVTHRSNIICWSLRCRTCLRILAFKVRLALCFSLHALICRNLTTARIEKNKINKQQKRIQRFAPATQLYYGGLAAHKLQQCDLHSSDTAAGRYNGSHSYQVALGCVLQHYIYRRHRREHSGHLSVSKSSHAKRLDRKSVV